MTPPSPTPPRLPTDRQPTGCDTPQRSALMADEDWEASIDAWKAEMESLTLAELLALDLSAPPARQHTTDEETDRG